MTDMTIPAQIIEREFRNAVNDQTSPMRVDFISDEELITITRRSLLEQRDILYTCSCEGDDEFVFLRRDQEQVVRFSTPADWIKFFEA